MVLTPFPSAGKQLEKVLNLYHARSYENPSIFDFKQSDGKLCQNRKQGGYGAYMGNRISVPTKKLIHLFSCCNPDLYRDTGVEQCNPKGVSFTIKK